MTGAQVLAGIVSITAAASYVNDQFIKLPKSIGLTLITFIISSMLIISCQMGFEGCGHVNLLLDAAHFQETFLDVMLGFLLFAAALNIHYKELAQQKWIIAMLATVSVAISSMIVGSLLYLLSGFLNVPLHYNYCLLFGALISPTDPIAVLGVLKTVKVPKSLEMKIAGEALFNDAMGLVLFIVVLGIATGEASIDSGASIAWYFMQQGVGGIVFGAALGSAVALMLRNTSSFEVGVLLTLAVVTGGYTFAHHVLEVSGIISMATAGLILGPFFRLKLTEMRVRLMSFWEIIDEVLNAFLFVLIGLECLTIHFSTQLLTMGAITIFIVLFARFVSVAVPIGYYSLFRHLPKHMTKIMTWGGLRGGVSIALALSLPESPERDIIVAITYWVVIFSILVQGLTIKPLLLRLMKSRG